MHAKRCTHDDYTSVEHSPAPGAPSFLQEAKAKDEAELRAIDEMKKTDATKANEMRKERGKRLIAQTQAETRAKEEAEKKAEQDRKDKEVGQRVGQVT
jgi:outer membrane scaffolding protein for murein synthesis (MipA/OmpV family)